MLQVADQISRDLRTLEKAVLRIVLRELPPKRERPNDPRLDAATLRLAAR